MSKKLYDENGNVVKGTKVKKPFYKRWWFILLVAIFIIGAIGGGDDEESLETTEAETEEVVEETEPEEIEEVVEKEPEEEVEEEVEPEETYDNVFEEKANEVFGGRLQDVFVDEAGEATEHYVGITSKLGAGWNEKTMRDSFYYDVVAMISELQNEEFDRLVFDATADMQDEYGNVKEMKVITVNLTKETVDKINFENFQSSNLPNVADAMFIHPAFQ